MPLWLQALLWGTVAGAALQQSGFAVHGTSSGFDGVEAVRMHCPDIVTMDVGLPDFDGLEASRRIRTFSDAYLIIVTSRGDEADALMGFEAGADDYLTKPFRPRELRARIAAMLRRPRSLSTRSAEPVLSGGRHREQTGHLATDDGGRTSPGDQPRDEFLPEQQVAPRAATSPIRASLCTRVPGRRPSMEVRWT
ncbi:response regulator transcription factor [Pseudarthrobacter sp. NamE2]|uniref:response regulator transcription factor n=1 Tax=Pseudarthrobacter sp. NamE2 TaxID=2576838 RepID=UPI003512A2D1